MWVVQGKKVDIPLNEGIEGVREALTLFSVLPFSPTFNICDASFPLGLRDQKLVTGSRPLEGSAYSLFLSVLPDNTLKVESVRELLVSNLKATPTSMGIRGRDGDRFVVVQHLVSGRGADETEDPRQPDANAREKGDLCQKPDVITWTLAGILATMIVAFLVLLIIHYLSTRTNKLGNPTSIQTTRNTAQPEATPVLVPARAPGPPPVPGPLAGSPVPSTLPNLCHLGHRAPPDHLSRKSPAATAHLTSQTPSGINFPGPSWLPPALAAGPGVCDQRGLEGDDEQGVYFEMDLRASTLPPPRSYGRAVENHVLAYLHIFYCVHLVFN
nr:uncharacterized protein LOC113801215 isoform X1 [Penaeus vannamei]